MLPPRPPLLLATATLLVALTSFGPNKPLQLVRAVPVDRSNQNPNNIEQLEPTRRADGDSEFERHPSELDSGRQAMATRPYDRCGRNGPCPNKDKMCQAICRSNPMEGGKVCNCDTYALRGNQPNFTDCNRLL